MALPKTDPYTDAARWLIIGFVVALAAAALAFFAPERFLKDSPASKAGIRFVRDRYEIGYYYAHSEWIAKGALPYTSEASLQAYPPLGAIFLALPRLFTDDILVYEAYSLVRSVTSFALLFAVTAVLLRRFGRSRKLLLFFFLPAFLYFSLWRYDTFPALFASLAVLAVVSESYGGAVVALAAGIAAKIYPVFFLLPLGMRLESDRSAKARGSAVKGLIVVAAVGAACLLAAKALGMEPFDMILGTHVRRPAEAGSIRELVIRFAETYGARTGSARWPVTVVFGLLQLGAALPLYWRHKVAGPKGYVRACLYVLIPFATFGWFFSQQWIIWIAPLALLVADREELALLAFLDVFLYLQFPVLYDMDYRSPAFDAATVGRTFVLCWLWALNAAKLRREKA